MAPLVVTRPKGRHDPANDFRRLRCDLLGEEVEKEEIPADFQLVGNMVQDCCYNNAKSYFGWE